MPKSKMTNCVAFLSNRLKVNRLASIIALSRNIVFLSICLCSSQLHAADNSLPLVPFQGSIQISDYLYTAQFSDQHISEVQEDQLKFIRESLVPSIDDPEIAELSNLNWQQNSGDTITNDSPNGLTWFYIDLENNSSTEIEALIEFTDFDGVGWIYFDDAGQYQLYQPDYGSFLGGRVVFDSQSVVPRTIEGNSTDRFIGFFYSVSVPRVSQTVLWEPESFREQRAKQHFSDGIYYGFLFALVLYNLVLCVFMRQLSYLYAGAFQLCVGIIVFIGTGYSTIFLFENNLEYTVPFFGSVFILAGVFGALFSIDILQMRTNNLLLYKIWVAAIIWSCIQIPIIAYSAIPTDLEVNDNRIFVQINFLVFIASQALHVYTLAYFWNRTNITKLWFVAVTLQVWVLVLWQISGTIGYGIVDLLRYLVQIFTVLNGILLTWLIRHRINEEQHQRELAQAEALSNLQIANAIQQSKSNFISTAGHDLRQPLEAMRLHIASIKKETSDRTKTVLKKVENNIRELSNLLTSLMNLSKSTSYVDSSTSEVFLLNEILQGLEDEVEPFVKQKNLTLCVDNAPFYVQSSKVGVTQIIRNILNNSIRYTKSGSVTIKVEDIGSEVSVSVIDTGPGIPHDELENIFNEYVQLNESDSSLQSGLGLGLSIVDRLAKSLEITLNVESTVGKGTQFSLNLPKFDKALVAEARSPDASSLSGFQIAILHKDQSSCAQLKEQLEQWGAMAMGWTDLLSADAYTCSHAWQPDMIVASQSLYEELQAHKYNQSYAGIKNERDGNHFNSRIGILSSDFTNLPILVLYDASSSSTIGPANEKGANPKHRWFQDPINPGVLRSFIQRLVVSPSN